MVYLSLNDSNSIFLLNCFLYVVVVVVVLIYLFLFCSVTMYCTIIDFISQRPIGRHSYSHYTCVIYCDFP